MVFSSAVLTLTTVIIGVVLMVDPDEFLLIGLLAGVYRCAIEIGFKTTIPIYFAETLSVRSTGTCIAFACLVRFLIGNADLSSAGAWGFFVCGVTGLLFIIYIKLDLLETQGLSHYDIFMRLK